MTTLFEILCVSKDDLTAFGTLADKLGATRGETLIDTVIGALNIRYTEVRDENVRVAYQWHISAHDDLEVDL